MFKVGDLVRMKATGLVGLLIKKWTPPKSYNVRQADYWSVLVDTEIIEWISSGALEKILNE